MQFSILFLKSSMTRANNLTIDQTNFLTDGFLQIIQRTGFVSVNARFRIPTKGKITCWKIGRARAPRHVSETGNEVPGKCVSNYGHWLVCSVCCHNNLVDTTHWHRKRMPTTTSPQHTCWVLCVKKMWGSCGSPCI
jgi:hypothetical protein